MVKKIMIFTIVFVFVLLASDSAKVNSAASLTDCDLSKISNIIKKVTPSVIRVTVYENGQALDFGSAFFIKTPQGVKILTAGHLVPTEKGDYSYKGASIVNIKTFQSSNFTMTLEKVSRKYDLALFGFTSQSSSFVAQPIVINDYLPEIGSVAIMIGAPGGFFPQYTLGLTSRLFFVGDGAVPYMMLSAAAAPGNSGGPALDCNGQVIGITLLIVLQDVSGGSAKAFVGSFIHTGPQIIKFLNSK
ncbi:MAG: serine protease [Patescibacteria group bacterium]|nr:serine protease [Patescibacteria group bacterium]